MDRTATQTHMLAEKLDVTDQEPVEALFFAEESELLNHFPKPVLDKFMEFTYEDAKRKAKR